MKEDSEHVIITGAGGGIGRGIVQHLSAQGLRVLAIDRDARALEAAEAATDPAGRFEGMVADVTMFSSAVDAVDMIGERRLRGVVNCAGTFRAQQFEEVSVEDYEEAIGSNLVSTIAMCRAALPRLRVQRYGCVVNIASTAGEFGSVRPAAMYAAAKGGVIALTKSLAREYGEYGVRVNAVSPGPTATTGFQPESVGAMSNAAARTLLGRMGTPSDIAFAVGFLLDPGASWITGEVLRVNGGSLL